MHLALILNLAEKTLECRANLAFRWRGSMDRPNRKAEQMEGFKVNCCYTRREFLSN